MIAFHFFVFIALCLISAFFSMTETALFSLTKIEKRRLQEKTSWLIVKVFDHLKQPRRTLMTVLIGNMIANTWAASLATLILLDLWGEQSLGMGMAVFTFLFILFCEVIPKAISVVRNQKIVVWTALPLEVFAIIFFPFRWAARFITDWILIHIAHERRERPDQISESELKAIVKIGEEEGILDSEEHHMIQKLFNFGERPVKAIMTPRIDLIGLDTEEKRQQHIEIIKKHHFSFLPVYQENLDHVLGIVSVQEMMLWPEKSIQSLLAAPLFIPETKRIDELLELFQKKQVSLAICIDEHGGTSGIVTLEDILEEIFGEYYDEYAKVENPIRSINPQEYLVEAKVNLRQFNDYFGASLQARESETLGGFILEKLGEIPNKGKTLEEDSFIFKINDVIRQRIRTVLVVRK